MLFWHRFRYYSFFFSSSFVWIYSSSSPSSFILRVPWTSTDGLRLRKKHHGWEKRLCFQLHYSIQTIHFYLLMNVILKDNDPIHVFNCLNTPSCLCLHSFKVLNRHTALSCLPPSPSGTMFSLVNLRWQEAELISCQRLAFVTLQL